LVTNLYQPQLNNSGVPEGFANALSIGHKREGSSQCPQATSFPHLLLNDGMYYAFIFFELDYQRSMKGVLQNENGVF
jgi:hypothetical protein